VAGDKRTRCGVNKSGVPPPTPKEKIFTKINSLIYSPNQFLFYKNVVQGTVKFKVHDSNNLLDKYEI
jgi:hypothetical protein